MARDKTESNIRIRNVAKEEFLEKGFEKASMRDIGKKAGMTQAGLYRHFASKEDMFASLVEPLITKICSDAETHENNAYSSFDRTNDFREMTNDNMVKMMKGILSEYYDEIRLLVCCSHGTRYENFIHDLVTEETKHTLQAFDYIRASGLYIREISEDELHVILSAYMTAVLEPVAHNWPLDKALKCLDQVEAFFMPAWEKLMGDGKENN